MKDSKPIIFDDELREAFERPLKKYPKLQKVILKQPDETDKEDIFFTKLLIPYVSVMWYLCTHDSAVFDAFMAFIKDLGALESIPRLKTDGVFEVLSHLSSRNASILLSKIECTDGSYSELLDSLENGDKTRFVAALKDCNTTPINPPLKIFQKSILIEEKLNKLEFYLGSPQEIREDFFSKPDDYYVNNIIKEIFGFAFAPEESNEFVQAFANGMKAAKRLNSAENNDNGLTAILYDFMLGLFSSLKGKDVLNDDAVDVMNYILKRPPFGNEYYHYQKYWENEGSDDEAEKFLARYPQLQIHKLLQETNPNVEDEESGEEAEVVEEPQSTPQIEEPNKEEVKEKVNRDEENDSVSSPKTKERWRLQKYLCRDPGLDKDSQLDYCKGFKKSIVEAGDAGDRALTKFIQYLADNKYIDNDKINKNSFAYALTGRGNFRKMKIITVRWHHKKDDTRKVPESVSVLLYISSNLFDSEKGKTYSQLFNVLDAGPNPCIKDGKDQSSAYYDKVSEDFEEYFNECFGQFTKDFDKNTLNK